MAFDIHKHHRRSIRLKDYDYSNSGAYFITLCTYQRQHLFGRIREGVMHLNPLGEIVAHEWEKSARIRQEASLGNWVVMPNHFHAIVVIDRDHGGTTGESGDRGMTGESGDRDMTGDRETTGEPGENLSPLPDARRCDELRMKPRSLSSLITGFKSSVTRQNGGQSVWQRNYHEHIIRDQTAWETIDHYISTNPKKWHQDSLRY